MAVLAIGMPSGFEWIILLLIAAAIGAFVRNKRKGNALQELGGGIVGGCIGGVLGMALSYFFQPGILRQFMSLGTYMSEASSIVRRQETGQTLVVTTLIGFVAGWLIGTFLVRSRQRSGGGTASEKE